MSLFDYFNRPEKKAREGEKIGSVVDPEIRRAAMSYIDEVGNAAKVISDLLELLENPEVERVKGRDCLATFYADWHNPGASIQVLFDSSGPLYARFKDVEQ